LHVFLQVQHARSVAARHQQAFEIVAAKKRAERALMMEERQRQMLVREQQAAEAAAAAAAHEAAVRREYTALRQALRIPEVVPDRHMLLPSMERKIEEMKQEQAQLQQLRLQQQAANELRSQQQQQAVLAAAALEAQKPKLASRQVSSRPTPPPRPPPPHKHHAYFSRPLLRSTGHLISRRASLPVITGTTPLPPLLPLETGWLTVWQLHGACRSSSCRQLQQPLLPQSPDLQLRAKRAQVWEAQLLSVAMVLLPLQSPFQSRFSPDRSPR
jgi:hypothetical protein